MGRQLSPETAVGGDYCNVADLGAAAPTLATTRSRGCSTGVPGERSGRLTSRAGRYVGWRPSTGDAGYTAPCIRPVDVRAPRQVSVFDASAPRDRPVLTGRQCFACTAGHGSSCAGAGVRHRLCWRAADALGHACGAGT
ncbi:MAG: DUF3641 domain-containing protein [Planctomycetota bacterium]